MGSDEQRQREPRADDTAANVVRFPRNWIGPLEELVPFGPSAERATAVEAPTLSADAFWGEDAGSLHAVMQAPRAGGVADSHTPPPLRAEPQMSAQPPLSAAQAGLMGAGGDARARLPLALWRGPAAVAVLFVVALLALVVAPVVSSLRGHKSDVHKSLAYARSRGAAARSRRTEELARTRQSGVGGPIGVGGAGGVGDGKAARRLLPASTSSARTNHRSRVARTARARAHSLPNVAASAAPAAEPQPRSQNSTQSQNFTQSSQNSTQSSQNSTYTQAANSGVSAVSVSQIRTTSGSSGAVAGTDGSSHLDSASPLPVPGGPPAP
jgi:hypothetical protein